MNTFVSCFNRGFATPQLNAAILDKKHDWQLFVIEFSADEVCMLDACLV